MNLEEILCTVIGVGMFLAATQQVITKLDPYHKNRKLEKQMQKATMQSVVPEGFAIGFLVGWCVTDLTRRLEQLDTNKFVVVEPDGTGSVLIWNPTTTRFECTGYRDNLGDVKPACRPEKELEKVINQIMIASFTASKLREQSQLKLLSVGRDKDNVSITVKLGEPT